MSMPCALYLPVFMSVLISFLVVVGFIVIWFSILSAVLVMVFDLVVVGVQFSWWPMQAVTEWHFFGLRCFF